MCEGFELEMVPNKAADQNKTGITIKGNEPDYLEAHRILKDFFRIRGQKYHINGIDVRIVDLPKNKLIKIKVKAKMGLSGKVNLNIYDVNKLGGATMMVQKVSGEKFDHVKIFGLQVIKFLIDGIIEGSIEEENMEWYKVKSDLKMELKEPKMCEICEKTFKSDKGIKIHMKTHENYEKNKCDLCENIFETKDKLEIHIKKVHTEFASPDAKKQKKSYEEMDTTEQSDEVVNEWIDLEATSWEEKRLSHRNVEMEVNEDELDQMEEYDEKDRKGKVEERLEREENRKIQELNDRKVLNKQKEWFDEEVRYQEMKKKYSEEKEKNENNRKRQMSCGKKKKSRSKKKNKIMQEEVINEVVKDIPDKFDSLFQEVGLNRKDYKIYKVKADGACASNCVAVHCHGEGKLGTYVRRNMNKYEADFFPFFRPFFVWPHTEMVGLKSVTFQNEKDYTEFLRNDPDSGKLWMDHQGLQIVANAYQMKISILTVGVQDMEEPKARWTHLVPDTRLEDFKKVEQNVLVDDMWMIHKDGVHFDLIIKKESVLATKELIVEISENINENEIIEKETEVGPGYMGWRIPEEDGKLL